MFENGEITLSKQVATVGRRKLGAADPDLLQGSMDVFYLLFAVSAQNFESAEAKAVSPCTSRDRCTHLLLL